MSDRGGSTLVISVVGATQYGEGDDSRGARTTRRMTDFVKVVDTNFLQPELPSQTRSPCPERTGVD